MKPYETLLELARHAPTPDERGEIMKLIHELRQEEAMANHPQILIKGVGGGVGGGGGGGVGGMEQAVFRRPQPYSLEQKMAVRMDWGQQGGPWAVGFSHMAMHRAGEMVHIWIITKDAQSVVLEDDAALYPSDALITKIRLMQQEN